MKELLIDVYEMIICNNCIIISIVKKGNKFIVEKCIVSKDNIKLIYSEEFNKLENAKEKYNKLKTTL